MEKRLRDKLPDGVFPDVEPHHARIMKGVRSKGNRTTEVRFQAALIDAEIHD